jgi:hypothetical protein
MKAICKLDYGQFEVHKTYDYTYSNQNNFMKFHVEGQYGTTEFNKKQFEGIFNQIKTQNKNKSYNF